jgi:hypothetical protein
MSRACGLALMLHVVARFCEDIREEASGLHTIVGVMPDNLQSPSDLSRRSFSTIFRSWALAKYG